MQEGTVRFNCPQCQEHTITRTAHERRMAAPYRCQCGFEGPN